MHCTRTGAKGKTPGERQSTESAWSSLQSRIKQVKCEAKLMPRKKEKQNKNLIVLKTRA